MSQNVDNQLRDDVARLVKEGALLSLSLRKTAAYPQFVEDVARRGGDGRNEFLRELPEFDIEYQSWYSEAISPIKVLLPDRYSDFRKLYEKPKDRTVFNHETCRIEDALLNVHVLIDGKPTSVKPWAIPLVEQQYAILRALEKRLSSSVFGLRQLMQRDLLDSELNAARELLAHGYLRAAGMIAGVVLERKLFQISQEYGYVSAKKNPTISDFNDLLKENEIIDLAQWRLHQYLADIRNICGHARGVDPTKEQIESLVSEVARVVSQLK